MSELKPTVPIPDAETYDSGDPKQVKRKRERGVSKDTQRKNDFRTLLGMAEGRRVFTWMLEQAGPYRTSFSTNALSMAYQEGIRKLGLQLTDQIANADPEAWVAMQLEILTPKEGTNA